MIGCHFTPFENTEDILKNGLKCKPTWNNNLAPYIEGGVVNGVWIYEEPLDSDDKLMAILAICAQQNTTHVTEFAVTYKRAEILKAGEADNYATIRTWHSIKLEKLISNKRLPAHIITVDISPVKITFVADYNLKDLIK